MFIDDTINSDASSNYSSLNIQTIKVPYDNISSTLYTPNDNAVSPPSIISSLTLSPIFKPTFNNIPKIHILNNDLEYDEEATSLINSNYNIVSQNIQFNKNISDEPIQHVFSYYEEIGFVKIKYFTLISWLCITLTYIIDSQQDNSNYHLMTGYISLWPECKDNRYQIWRFITGALLHSNLDHYLINAFCLVIFSYILEVFQYYYLIAPLFLIGIIHGDLAFYYTQPYGYALGISQGVYSIIGMLLANVLININYIDISYILLSIILICVILVGEGYSYDETNHIAYIAHWCSALSGFLGGVTF